MSWEDAWREGRTGWDAGGSPPALIELVEAGVLPVGRALVPGCGAGYDVLTLASAVELSENRRPLSERRAERFTAHWTPGTGSADRTERPLRSDRARECARQQTEREVIGLDLAETAAARFRALREARGVPEARARVITADFFAYEPDAPFDLIWDYTFLCAIDPSQRAAWAEKVDALLAPGGELAMLIFPATEEPPFGKGPPFALPVREVRALLEPRFTAVQLEPARRSHPGREGMEHVARWRRR